MQPFDPFTRRDNQSNRGRESVGRIEVRNETPAFGDVMAEMGVVLLACLSLALAAQLLTAVAGGQ